MTDAKGNQKKINNYLKTNYGKTISRLSVKEKKEIALSAGTPEIILSRLSGDKSEDIRQCVALNPGVSPEILARSAEDSRKKVRMAVAGNPNAAPEILARIASDESVYVRWRVGGNLNTPTAILMHLASDESVYVRQAVAENPNASAKMLARLGGDGRKYVRRSVSGNSTAPTKVLVRLASDKDEGVRRRVAKNPGTPPEILARLASDRDKGTSTAATQNPRFQELDYRDFVSFGDEKMRAFVVSQAMEAGDLGSAVRVLCGARSRLLLKALLASSSELPGSPGECLKLIRAASVAEFLKNIELKNVTGRIAVYAELISGGKRIFRQRTQWIDTYDLKIITAMIRVSKAKLFNMINEPLDDEAEWIFFDTVYEALAVLDLAFESKEEREEVLKNYLSNLRLYEPKSLDELHNFVMKYARLAKTFDPKAAVVSGHPIYSTDLVGEWYHRLEYGKNRTFALMVPETETEYSENGAEQQVCLGTLRYADDVRSGRRVVVNILDVDRDEVIGSILYDIGVRGALNVAEAAYKDNRPGGLEKALPGLTKMIGDHIDGVIYDFLVD